ncbi:MAG TPA: trypsin-like peptidase domain-containing protein [Tepidisphaeraceae bacterium]|jgi:serine protease Do|nr:trypsin-like peptidase domain-containing protein [Tepidisphaeraceae bacterium]
MSLSKKPLATLALAAACTAAGYVGFDAFENAQFARAEQRVDATREQLSSVNDLASVFKSVNKVMEQSVVSIEVTKTSRAAVNTENLPPQFRRFFDRDGDGEPDMGGGEPQRGIGSGVIMEVDGSTAYIVTNNHVAGDAQEMEITLSDGRVIDNGKLLGTDPKSDLAVVKITADRVMAAKWGNSDQLSKGDWVLAFGSPLGYVGSMTHGIVSALERQSNPRGGVGVLGPGGYENFIQVDAPINPGNSGGPLANVTGEVIGINTAIASRTGGFQGIGFAIPSNQAKPIYESLKNTGKVTRGWLGVEIADVARLQQQAKAAGYNGTTGILVNGALRGTPAFGKLQPGDVITSMNGKELRNTQELRNEIAVTKPGTEVTFGVTRNGKTSDVKVTVGAQPDDVNMARGGPQSGPPGQASVESMGFKVADATDALRRQFGIEEAGDGALVTAVDASSTAAAAGLRVGDLITKINDQEVNNATAARDALQKADPKSDFSMLVVSKQGSRLVFIPAEAIGGGGQ